MDIVFDDDNARVLRSVYEQLISAVEDDVVAVARIACYQGVTTTNCLGPSGEMISKFKLRAVGDSVEIVVAVDQAGQTLLDDVEERVERCECRVLGIGHDLRIGLTPAISRRARNLETIQVSRMKTTLFAVGCMALLGAAQFYNFKQTTCPTMCCSGSTFTPAGFQVGRRCP